MDWKLDMAGGGTLRLRQEGGRVRVQAVRPWDGRGLYKVWLSGGAGGRMLLGTLAPEGDCLRLERNMSLDTLERAGCWPPTGAEAPLAFPFSGSERWYCEQHPERLIQDPVARGAVKGPMLCQRGDAGFCLAAPFRTDSPMPLSALFCLARIEQVEGRPHLVWRFNREGGRKSRIKGERTGKLRPSNGDLPGGKENASMPNLSSKETTPCPTSWISSGCFTASTWPQSRSARIRS